MDVFGRSVSKRYLQLFEIMEKENTDLDGAAEALFADRARYVADEEDEAPETHPYMDEFNTDLGGNAYGGDYIIELARQLGRKGGRKRQMTDSKIESAKKLLASGIPPRDVAKNLGVSVPTLYRWIPASMRA